MLKIGVWNANGLVQRIRELKYFLYEHTRNIDVMLISKTHFTKKSYINISHYNIYDTQHPDETAYGRSTIIVKATIKHHVNESYKEDYLQATSITIEDWTGPITLAAIYIPPRHSIKQEQ